MGNSNLQLTLDPSVGFHKCSGVPLPGMMRLWLCIGLLLSSGIEVGCVKSGAPLALLRAAGRGLLRSFRTLWHDLVLVAFGLPCLSLSSGTGSVLGCV